MDIEWIMANETEYISEFVIRNPHNFMTSISKKIENCRPPRILLRQGGPFELTTYSNERKQKRYITFKLIQ